MKPCLLNRELPATCNDCSLIPQLCEGIDEQVICQYCGAVIINQNSLIEHISINHI